ncbi:hypothetical protein ACHAQJ_000896 [Trichoderma viride]
MSHGPDNFTGPANEGIGLRFLNEEWNDSISSGHPFTIRWNESLDETRAPELGLFKITYPKNGVVVYELVSNLTGVYNVPTELNDTQTYSKRALLDGMNNKNATCLWTPGHLDDELYTLWLSSSRDARSNWTTSPPWRLSESPRYPFHWAAPIVIPIVVMLAVYTLGVTTCVIYRRRRKARREKEDNKENHLDKEKAGETPALFRDTDRHPSVDTVVTIQSLDSPDELKKPNVWLLTQSASGSLFLSSPSRKNSDATLVSPTALSAEPILVSPISSSEQTLQSPTSIYSERTFVTLSDPRDQKVVVAGRQGRSLRLIVPSNSDQE